MSNDIPSHSADAPSPVAKRSHSKHRRITAYSRDGMFSKLDQRSSDGRFLKRLRADLARHVGGSPSTTQRLLIDRAAMLSLRLAKLDEKMVLGEGLTDHDTGVYLAWSNALARTLKALGLKAAPEPVPTAAEALARHRAEKAAQQAKDAA